MGAPSKAERLPGPLREALARLWFDRRFGLDDLVAHLNALATGERSLVPKELAETAVAIAPDDVPSRSSLHRHLLKARKMADKMRQSRMVAEVLASELGDASEDKLARANFELLHSAVNEIFMAAAQAEDGESEDGPPITLDPKAAMMLAKALHDVEGAKKTHLDLRAQIRKEVQTEAAKAAEAVAKKAGLSADLLDQLKAGILGKDAA